MSRSRKKTPIFGNAKGSEKQDKRKCNRSLRHKIKVLTNNYDEDKTVFPEVEEVMNVWSMTKDGKVYRINTNEKNMRK